jgi:DNA polymerase V
MTKVFALVDCNNFYASCKKLFRPDLDKTPVVVLSNNDGWVVARSQEAKALGIKWEFRTFKLKNLQKHMALLHFRQTMHCMLTYLPE